MKLLIHSLLTMFFSISIALNSYSAEKGSRAISIPLKLLENSKAGKTVGVNTYQGKLIYVDFWASWCGPCRKSLPILNEIRAQYSNQGFEVVAVNVDEKLEDALKFLEKYPVDYPILLDPKGSMPKAYNIKGMPTAFLVDETGKIIYKHTGFKKRDRKKIEKLINQHLASR